MKATCRTLTSRPWLNLLCRASRVVSWCERAVKAIASKDRRTSFTNNRRPTRSSMDPAPASTCMARTLARPKWCSHRRLWRLRHRTSSSNKTWMLISRIIISTRAANRATWIASTCRNNNNSNNRKCPWVAAMEMPAWWREIINSNSQDSGSGEAKVNLSSDMELDDAKLLLPSRSSPSTFIINFS